MKLSPKTITILKNFATINPSMIFKSGHWIATLSPTRTIFARSHITETFPKTFAIYDLNKFLACLSLMNEPELTFGDTSVKISDGNKTIVYHYAEISLIKEPPDKAMDMPSKDAQCVITTKDLQGVLKGVGVLGLNAIAICGDNKNITLEAVDTSQASNDTYSVVVGETDTKFSAVFSAEKMRMVDSDYTVTLSKNYVSEFVGTDVTYWIAMETSSVF